MSTPIVNGTTDGSYPTTAGYAGVEAGEYEVVTSGTWGSATVTWKGLRGASWITLSSDLVFTADSVKIVQLADGWAIRADISGATTATALNAWLNKTTPNVD